MRQIWGMLVPRRARDDRGTVIVLVAAMMVVFLGLIALAADAGSWWRAQRNVQAAADAAALGAAQDLPNTATATATAYTYAGDNATGLSSWSPTFPTGSPCDNNACIDVVLSKDTPSFFAKAVGFGDVTVHGHARAGVGVPGSMKNLAAIVVNQNRACRTGDPCFGPSHLVDLNFDGSPGAGAAAGLVDLAGHNANQNLCTANASTATIKGWIDNGFSGILPVNEWYGSPPGAKNGVQSSLDAAAASGRVLLFPVFDTGTPTACGGAGGFHIIGWSAFIITQVVIWNNSGGGNHTLRGYFVEFIAHDVESVPGIPGFGVKVITLMQ